MLQRRHYLKRGNRMNGQKCEACGNTALVEKDGKLLCESCGNIQEIQNEEKSEIEVLLDEAFESLLYKDWDKVDKICDKVLKVDKNCSGAYLGKLLAETQCQKQSELKKLREPFDESKNYKAIQKLEDTELIDALAKDNATIIEINSSFGFTESGSTKTKKSIKGFAIASGVLFILSSIVAILRAIQYNSWGTQIRYIIPQTVMGIVLFLLSIFVFKREKGAITVMWAILTIHELLRALSGGYSYILEIIMIAVFVLFTLLNAFQKSLLKKKMLRFVVFVIPLLYGFLYGFFGIVGGYSIFELAQIAFCFLAMIFYLLMLINCNKVSKYKKEK